jgi:hypothetical protein
MEKFDNVAGGKKEVVMKIFEVRPAFPPSHLLFVQLSMKSSPFLQGCAFIIDAHFHQNHQVRNSVL